MKIRSGLWLGLYAVFFLAVTLTFLVSYPIPELRSKILAFASASFLFICLHALGRLVLRLPLQSTSESPAPSWPVFEVIAAVGVGWGILSLFVLMAGWAVQLPLRAALTAASFLLAAIALRSYFKQRRLFPAIRIYQKLSLTEGFILSGAGIGFLVTFVAAFSPITYYDSLVYHLALPSLYNQWNTIKAVPFNLYSLFPGNAEMIFLYILNQLPEPEYTINLICLFISVALSLGLAEWAEEVGGMRMAILTLFFWWTMPAVLLLSIGAYVDIILAFFILLSLRSFYRAMNLEWDSRWMFFSGIFSGLAFSTKYTGAICPILLGLFLLWKTTYRRQIPLSRLLIFSGGALLPALFWMIKNAVTVGNPVFPFLYSWLGGDVGWTQGTASAYFALLSEYNFKSHVFFEMITAPWRLLTSSTTFGGGFDVLGDFGWAPVIFGAPLAFFFAKKKRTVLLLGAYFVAHGLIWFLSKPVLRFFIAALPIGIFLASYAVHALFQSRGKWGRSVLVLLILPWIVSNLFIYSAAGDVLRPFDVALGVETRQEFLRKRLAYYPVFETINQSFTDSEKVLILGEQRTYHLKKPFVSANLFAPSPISRFCNQAKSAQELRAFFMNEGITHVLIHWGEVKRLGGLTHFGFEDHGIQVLSQFLDQFGKLEKNEREVALYRVRFPNIP